MDLLRKITVTTALGLLVAAGGPIWSQEPEPAVPTFADEAIAAAIEDETVRLLVADVLERNPRLAAARAEAAAAALRAPQVAALPDPVAGLTLFLQSPETRVGPQRGSVSLSQRFPWFGKLRLRERAAVLEAASAEARVGAIRLELITETRRLAYEIAFLRQEAEIVRRDLQTLDHFEELARARYASGVGLGQAVVKIQAEITRAQTRLLDIGQQLVSLEETLNALRDRSESTPVLGSDLPDVRWREVDDDALRAAAVESRPEIAAERALSEAAGLRVELAGRDYRPDLTAGLSYTVVGDRDDRMGELNPPEDNGKDILGVSASVNLPVWRDRLAAGVEEAVERELAAEESLRDTIVSIRRQVDDLLRRIPLIAQELELYENVLLPQAEEALDSVLGGYSSGTHDALDLLDAERVLLQVRIAAARTLTDYAIAIARLEGAVARPVISEMSDE